MTKKGLTNGYLVLQETNHQKLRMIVDKRSKGKK